MLIVSDMNLKSGAMSLLASVRSLEEWVKRAFPGKNNYRATVLPCYLIGVRQPSLIKLMEHVDLPVSVPTDLLLFIVSSVAKMDSQCFHTALIARSHIESEVS